MTGCCLYCKFAESYWIDPAGDEQIQRRRDFFSQFERWPSHAQIIAQRNSNVLETALKNSTKQHKLNQEG